MCGRYTVNTEDEIIEMRGIIQEISIRLSMESNEDYGGFGREAYPSCEAPVILPGRKLKLLKWGFEKWDGKGVIFNARGEGVMTGRFFSPYMEKGRCIVPASSYFEWIRVNGKPAFKYRIFASSGKPIYMAGLLKDSGGGNGRYVIITRSAADNIKFIHHRMPLIFSESEALEWLAGNYYKNLLSGGGVPVGFEKYG